MVSAWGPVTDTFIHVITYKRSIKMTFHDAFVLWEGRSKLFVYSFAAKNVLCVENLTQDTNGVQFSSVERQEILTAGRKGPRGLVIEVTSQNTQFTV